MKELIMLRGCQASGKSTEAKKILHKELLGNAVIVNRDQLRLMLHDGKWSKNKENTTKTVRDAIIQTALSQNLSVIVDDMNLDSKTQEHLKQLASKNSASLRVVDFTHVSLDDCLERDKKRPNYVGEKVIRDTYNRYIRKPVEPAATNPKLRTCVICDIDGTTFTMKDRGPFEWSKVGQDEPRLHVMDAALGVGLLYNADIVFLSGRDEICRKATEEAIRTKLGVRAQFLYMRPKGDQRKDTTVKKELFEKHILGKYRVLGVFDDRACVNRLWDSLGLGDRLFRVGRIDQDDF